MSWEGALERARRPPVIASVRVAIVALILAAEGTRTPLAERTDAFYWVLVAGALYALTALALAWAGWRPRWLAHAESALDIAFLSALLYTSGGAFSSVRRAYYLLPVLAAFSTTSRATALWALLAPLSYAAVSFLHDPELAGRNSMALTTAAYMAAIGTVSVAVSALLVQREKRLRELAAEARTLATAALEASERERKRLAYALHDEPVQQLHAAQLELSRGRKGDREALGSARRAILDALVSLRETIFELHPHSLEEVGLATALEQLAERQRRLCGAEIVLDVDPAATGRRDELLFAVGRELLANAARHAEADRIDLRLARDDHALVLEVADDGRGIDSEGRAESPANGRFGLLAAAEQLRSTGGRLEIKSDRRGGTVVRGLVPDVPRQSAGTS